jgi:phosphoribosylamine--glycine ligase
VKILLVGSGGRENAIAWKMTSSDSFRSTASKLFCAPGNPGIEQYADCINVKADDIESLFDFAVRENIELTIVGPEVPLSLGIADKFRAHGMKVFGPDKAAAEIESSKLFAKQLMSAYNIPTAKFKHFKRSESDEALEFLASTEYPVVFKADGLAAGKGVVIADSNEEAIEALNVMCSEDAFGDASQSFVIEEFLRGEEVSVFCITDGDDFVLLPFSRDHKKIGEGETGKNTGGMGAVSPVMKFMEKNVSDKIVTKVVIPVLDAMRNEGRKFSGCLYCGLMICDGEPFVIEFNCRFGDPETQSVLPLISSDFLELLLASAEGKMKDYVLSVNKLFSCCVVLGSGGYPDSFTKGFEIKGTVDAGKTALVFHSGTEFKDGKLLTAGGRVLSVVGLSDESLENAINTAYESVSKIRFDGMTFRNDIGKQLLKKVEL